MLERRKRRYENGKKIITEQNIIEIIDTLYDDEEAIYIPQVIVGLTNICDDTKYIFGVAFCECLRKVSMGKNYIQQAVDMVKNYLETIEITTIVSDIECSSQKAAEIKEELLYVADEEILRECFHESFVHLVDSPLPEDVCLSNIMSKVEVLPPWVRRMIKSDIINMIEENYSIVD